MKLYCFNDHNFNININYNMDILKTRDTMNVTDGEEKLHSNSVVGKVYVSDKHVRKNYENSHHVFSEVKCLQFFSEKGFNVPKVLKNDDSDIVMEFIKDDCNNDNIREKLINKELNKLHSIKGDLYGSDDDGYCGNIRVLNTYSDNWITFFKFNRYKPVVDAIIESNPNILSHLLYAFRLYDIIEFIINKKVRPVLLHGDPNPRNFLISNNKVYFIDISCFYGDAEYDIACYDLWKKPENFKKTESHKKLLYYVFNLLLGFHLTKNMRRLEQANKYIKIILSSGLYDMSYPSLNKQIKCTSEYKKIVIMLGCFNPVHINHVNTMKETKKHISTNHHILENDILCVYALATDNIVNKKTSSYNFSLEDRINMLQLSLKDETNVVIDYSGLYVQDLAKNYKSLYPKIEDIYFCCGNDAFETIIKYIGDYKLFVAKRNDYVINKKLLTDNVILIDYKCQTMSSTLIKNDLNSYKHFLNDDVYEYIKKLNLYK